MVSLRFLSRSLERIGLVNLSEERIVNPRRKTLHDMFVIMQYAMISLCFGSHLLSTLTRSVRLSAEFAQAVLEDLITIISLYLVNFIRINYDQILSLLTIVENSFSKADKKILRRCEHQCKILFFAVVLGMTSTIFGIFLESILPVSAKVLEMRRFVYQTEHPERRHPFNVRYPFIDESKSWAFEIVFIQQVYVLVLMQCYLILTIPILPFTLFNVRSQYEMLANYIVKIGDTHRDEFGNEIVYTNIETNEYCVVKTTKKSKKIKDKARKIYFEKMAMRRKQEYEQNYLKQIVKFHQKLLLFHEKVCLFVFFQEV
uniref:Odorant receptor n=1 Tax=Cacopsylla melanoneura TaxID=428564 RepID=A0A8D8T4X9_9HEMI